jgi:DNA polymerase
MPDLYWDIEARSAASLPTCGAWRYAADQSTDVLCVCYAVDDGGIETWLPGQPVPEPFLAAAANPLAWRTIAHNAEFERAMLEHVLAPKHGFLPIPLEAQHCSMTLALANAYPAQLDLLARALELEYRKDPEGIRLMRQMSEPRKPRKGEDKNVLHWLFDEAKLRQLIKYCQQDVRTTRAVWRHPKLLSLSTHERRLQILDAHINRRGVRADRKLVMMARDLSLQEERARLNTALQELTSGAIETIDQIERILSAINAHGHTMTTLSKKSVSDVLAGEPNDYVRRMLELRRDGARASTKKYERILSSLSDSDDRVRGTMRMYGAGPGRWSGHGPQLQNLKKNESGFPLAAIEAVRSGDREQLRKFGNPLTVLADISRAVICASPGKVLVAADLSAIESRVLAWLADENWKLDAYRAYDTSGDKTLEPYRLIAAKMLQKQPQDITTAERQLGKAGDLACGFGGSVGAWRRIASGDTRPDPQIKADVYAWRQAHPKTTGFWHNLAQAIQTAIRIGRPIAVGKIVVEYTNGNLHLTLPSGRRITYPEARLVPSKYEGGHPDVLFKDNAHGKWTDYRGWFGTFVENVVQGTARDLLAAAIERFETRGLPLVLHVHDEVVAEVAIGSITESDFLAILLEPPTWAERLPLAGKVWSSTHYFEPPEQVDPPDQVEPSTNATGELEAAIDKTIDAMPETAVHAEPVDDDIEAVTPLFELASVPQTTDHKTTCPFHEGDHTPSLQFYADHYHCFGCGAHGDAIDWLTNEEGMSRDEALAAIQAGDQPSLTATEDKAVKTERALALWYESRPIAGTLAACYLAETRGIDLAALPADIDAALRFHPRCPFGPGNRHPCLLALLRDAITDQPIGIQRIALTPKACKIERRMLGQSGTVKLWPAGPQLVVGEGIETVLAAATRVTYHGAPLLPAWSAVSTSLLEKFPVLAGVERLIILVDHDPAGKTAAACCTERWNRAGRTVVRLTPKRTGADFNDIVMPEPVS